MSGHLNLIKVEGCGIQNVDLLNIMEARTCIVEVPTCGDGRW